MKAKEIQDLIDFIAKSGLDEVNIETESFKLSVKKSGRLATTSEPVYNPSPSITPTQVIPVLSTPTPTTVSEVATTPAVTKTNTDSNYITIKSPMIGTFYRSANPDSPLFVNVGDEVKQGQIVCIIEAMKLFNEIESEVSGKIVKVLVDNATPVEYDQPLFLVDPS